ncbi:MAG: PKD domain-containing protein [Bacteroidota bacterium]|nr:PKD domain-containing protein [Bacteroidota bacterium]
MKHILRILTIACLSLSANYAHASGGPDAYGYTWMTSLDPGGPMYSWIDVTSRSGVQTVTGLADDNSAAGFIPLGINFHYYWNDYSQLKVGSNGWVSFNNTSNIAACFPTIPSAGGPSDNYLAPLMGDLNFTGAGNPGQVKYWSNNVDTFIISYINVPFWSVNSPGWVGSNSFQVILCSSDSSITYQYGTLGGFGPNAACVDLVVGIENSTGTIGLQVHNDVMPPANYSIRFKYPNPVLLSIQDILPAWNINGANGAEFVMTGLPTTLLSDIRNSGNTAVTTAISLQSTILDAALTTVLSNTGVIPSMAAGDDSLFIFSNLWTPAVAGQYTNRTSTSNSQDINAANNTLNTELDAVNPCAPNMLLSYVTTGIPDGSINWNGGANDDGAAVYMIPPIYPYTVAGLQFYISSNVNNGYIAQVYDDNGPNGAPGTLLFTSTIPSASVISGNWNTVTVTPTVTLSSGGFYVVWLQGGTTIFLGTETAGPRSHRNYEILDASWSTFRYDDARDLCIRASINNYTNAPAATFTSSVNAQTGTFTDNSTGLVTSWSWNFGDSQTSTQQNPVHTYSAAGTYTVCLTSASPCTTSQVCQTINICFTPVAAYSSTTNVLDATFSDLSGGTITAWSWDFGDSQTSTQQNPTHTYSTGGTYNVCLITTNNCGQSDTFCQAVTVCGLPAAAYTSSTSALNASFTDQTTNNPVNWLWDFGDSQTSTQQNPAHTYAADGIYTVCLIATNGCGDDDTICQAVSVCNLPTASFTNTTNLLNLTFTDQTTNSPVSWMWDFGDSQTSTQQNPVHTYATAGTYTVCMVATNLCGDDDTTCQSITICAQPVASFTTSTNFLDVTFTDQTTNSPVTWLWDFGDSQTSSAVNPVHTYATDGTYTVCLIATNLCGYSDTTCTTITICGQIAADFTFTENQDSLFVTNTSTGAAVSWMWDFGDSQTSAQQNPATHLYSAEGIYTVCLTITDVCGNSDTACEDVTIVFIGVNEINTSLISGIYPNPVNDQLNISFNSDLTNGQLEIVDQAGRVVMSKQNVSGKTINLDVESLASGIYLLRVFDENGTSAVRFIRE